jgi:hypothetical protein
MTLVSTASYAENWGIRFDQMPVGTEYDIKDQTGDKWTYKFVGKKGKFYIVKKTSHQTKQNSRQKYNAMGHFVSNTYNDGYKFKRYPHSCYEVVGRCTHVQSGHKWSGKYVYNIKQVSPTKRVGTWRRVNTEETRDFKYTLGKYNIVVYTEHMYQGNKKFTKMTRLTVPSN